MVLTLLGGALLLLSLWWLVEAYRANRRPVVEDSWDKSHAWRKAFARAAPTLALGVILILLGRR